MKANSYIISTGCLSLDSIINGGFKPNLTYLIYGEAESGKTTLALQAAINAAKQGFKTIYVDADSRFSTERFSQIAGSEYEALLPLILVLRPESFREQEYIIDHLHQYVSGGVRLVVFDTLTTLYRLEVGEREETFLLNRELNRQVAFIADVTKKSNLATLIISQVRQVMDHEGEDVNSVEPVATRVLKFWADVIIALKRTQRSEVIQALVEKGAAYRDRAECYLYIGSRGLSDLEKTNREAEG